MQAPDSRGMFGEICNILEGSYIAAAVTIDPATADAAGPDIGTKIKKSYPLVPQ